MSATCITTPCRAWRSSSPSEEVAALAADPNVATIEPDVTMQASVDQSGADWGLDRIDQRSLPLSGTYSYPSSAGAGVKVYVIDTGVRSTHANSPAECCRATPSSRTAAAPRTATVTARTSPPPSRARRTAWPRPPSIVPIRVLDCLGSGSLSAIIAGLDWVLTFNARRTGGGEHEPRWGASFTVDVAVQRVIDSGVPVVVAAGNSNVDACASPARVAGAITVGAIAADDSRATYSNFGSCLDIFAPRTASRRPASSDVATTVKSGTSMATPHVAGVGRADEECDAVAHARRCGERTRRQRHAGCGDEPGRRLTESTALRVHHHDGHTTASPATHPTTPGAFQQDQPVEQGHRSAHVAHAQVGCICQCNRVPAVPRHREQQRVRRHMDEHRQRASRFTLQRPAVQAHVLLADSGSERRWHRRRQREFVLAVHHEVIHPGTGWAIGPRLTANTCWPGPASDT